MMEQYINKSALVAEIKQRLSLLEGGTGHPDVVKQVEGVIKGYKSILSFLNTLETKEVDLEREVVDYIEQHKRELSSGYFDIRRIARHFFVLGLNTQKGK